jgi:hypothetical protein
MSLSEVTQIYRRRLYFRNSSVFENLGISKKPESLSDRNRTARVSHHLKFVIDIPGSTDFDTLVRWLPPNPALSGGSIRRCRVEEQSLRARHQMIAGDYTNKSSGIWIKRLSGGCGIRSDLPHMFGPAQ